MGQHHEHQHSKKHTGSVVGAFVAGVLTTAAVGGYLLFGPGGRRRRRRIERWVAHARADILDKMEDLGDVTREQYDRIVDRVTEKYGRMRDVGGGKARAMARDFKRRFEEMKENARKARDDVESDMLFEEDDDDLYSKER